MSTGIIIAILFMHWIADFVMQTEWQATNKSKNNEALLQHTCVYSIVMTIPMVVWLMPMSVYGYGSLYFLGITFIAHTITDYFTSRLNSKLWNEKKVHWFFVSIGFDQILHYVQLILTFKFFTQL